VWGGGEGFPFYTFTNILAVNLRVMDIQSQLHIRFMILSTLGKSMMTEYTQAWDKEGKNSTFTHFKFCPKML